MMCYTFRTLAARIRGKLVRGPKDGTITGVSIDSREVRPGQVFFAIKGERFDGHDYVQAAFDAGAAAVVLQRKPAIEAPPGRGVLAVRDTRKALGEFAAVHRLRHPGPWIAVTGSVGKSTVKELVAHVLGEHVGHRRVLKAPKSFNNELGLPLTVLRAERRHAAHVLEIGSNSPGEIDSLAGICRPTTAVITAAAPVHLEKLRDLNGVAEEKGAILERLFRHDTAVLDMHSPFFFYWLNRAKCPVLAVSDRGDARADVFAAEMETQPRELRFLLNDRFPVTVPLAGRHHARNVLLAAAAAMTTGVPLEEIAEALRRIPQLDGRHQVIELSAGIVLVNDSYNASPAAFAAALEHLPVVAGQRRKMVVAGDMLELGGRSDWWHFEVGRRVAEAGADFLLGVGEFSGAYLRGAVSGGMKASSMLAVPSAEEAFDALETRIEQDSCILVKGSNRTGLSAVARRIEAEYGVSGHARKAA